MKKGIFTLFFSGILYGASAQYPVVPVDSVQFISSGRLAQVQFAVAGKDGTLADYVFPNANGKPYGDTVTIEGIVSYDPVSYGLSTSLSRQAAFLQSEAGGPWSGVEVMYDSAVQPVEQQVVQFKQNMRKGRKVRVTGRIRDFQGQTQLTVVNVPVQVVSIESFPVAPEILEVKDIMQVVNDQQVPQFVTGEPWEGVYVEFRNVIVVRDPNSPNGSLRYTWWVQDAAGNRIPIRDVSGYFRNDNYDEDPGTPLPFNPPPQGSTISYIRGVLVESGNNSFKTYSIAPLLPADIGTVIEPPAITEVSRFPKLARSTTPVAFRARITDLGSVAEARLNYAVGYSNDQFTGIPMTSMGNDIYTATIPAQPDGSFVKYYISATDNDGYTGYFPDSLVLNSGYKVIDDLNSIVQIQETPFPNGASTFTNDTLENISIRALVVATNNSYDLGIITIQSSNEPWGTIFVRPSSGDQVSTWKRGDSVLIKRALVTERIPDGSNPFGRTSTTGITFLQDIGAGGWEYLGRCLELPATAKIPFDSIMSLTFNKEPYESMLLELNDVYVVQKNADSVLGSNYGEFAVNPDVNAPTGLRADDYSNDLYVNRVSDSLNQNGLDLLPVFKGVLVNTYGNWKFLPRNRTDMSKAGDVIPPYLTLIGNDTIYLEPGQAINDPGANACDDEDGDVSGRVQIDSTQVDINTAGIYRSYYTAADHSGNESGEISRVIVVHSNTSVKRAEAFTLGIYPVPAVQELNIRISDVLRADRASLRILDMNGKTLIRKDLFVNEGRNDFRIDLSGLASGVYFCHIDSDGYVLAEKITVIR
jgi:hypothetical protein